MPATVLADDLFLVVLVDHPFVGLRTARLQQSSEILFKDRSIICVRDVLSVATTIAAKLLMFDVEFELAAAVLTRPRRDAVLFVVTAVFNIVANRWIVDFIRTSYGGSARDLGAAL